MNATRLGPEPVVAADAEIVAGTRPICSVGTMEKG